MKSEERIRIEQEGAAAAYEQWGKDYCLAAGAILVGVGSMWAPSGMLMLVSLTHEDCWKLAKLVKPSEESISETMARLISEAEAKL